MPGRRRKSPAGPRFDFGGPFIRSIALQRDRVESFEQYPYSIPAIRHLDLLNLHPKVTFFVGENGVGKSTLIEAIAVAAGFNAEGGSKNFNFETRSSESDLHQVLRLTRGFPRERDGFFLRAESVFNVATEIDNLGPGLVDQYGGRSLHEQSHGESFMALALHRFRGNGLYILDEPEAALAPSRQLAMLVIIHQLVTEADSQFIIATHSPILMAYPDATIYHLSAEGGPAPIPYEQTEHYRITRDFLNDRDSYFRHLFSPNDGAS
jgi:predicted ATPase